MKICARLLFPVLLLVFAPVIGRTQEITFTGYEIIKLANTITTEARRTGQLPSAYQLTMTNGHAMIISAPNAFELLCRSIIAWQKNRLFPDTVVLLLHDLSGPAPDPQYEPKRPGLLIAVLSADIERYTPAWLVLAQQTGHTLSKVMKFETNYSLTAAQFCVAMATLIDETAKTNDYPASFDMPQVRSPQSWQDTRTPLVVSTGTVAAPEPVKEPVKETLPPQAQADLLITLNGIELSEQGPVQPSGRHYMPPFCGTMHIEMSGTGPVASIRLLLDSSEIRVFTGAGLHTYDVNTLLLADGSHWISATAYDTEGKSSAYVFSFKVMNGRINGFTPAEQESAEVEQTPKKRRVDDVALLGLPRFSY